MSFIYKAPLKYPLTLQRTNNKGERRMKIKSFINLRIWIAGVLFMSLYNPLMAQSMKKELTERQQSIIPIAAFATKGDMEKLSAALNTGLDSGLTVNEIKELLVHLHAYAGFPRSLNGISCFKTVLEERTARGITDTLGKDASPLPTGKSSFELGTEIQTRLSGNFVTGGIMDFAPIMDYYLKSHLFGEMFGRDNISESDRELVTLSVLSSLEGTEGQLKSHLRYALNAGLTENQICSIADVLKERVGKQEAYRADKVINAAYGRKSSMSSPIEDIFPKGKISTTDYFTGTVWNQRLVSNDSTTHCQATNVTFEAGARTRWHVHSGTQILLCTAGKGWYQEQGQKARVLQSGDTVVIRPGVVHWHGADTNHEFSHISVIPNPEKNKDTWLEAVNEEDYRKLAL